MARTAKTLTAQGNAQVDTAQSKFGGASALFDGTGDYLRVTPWDSDFDVAAGDFTIDCWIRFASMAGYQAVFSGRQAAADDYNYMGVMMTNGTGYLRYFASSNGTSWDLLLGDTGAQDVGTTALSINTWYHFALVRSGNTYYGFLDGVQDWTKTVAGTIIAADDSLTIGNWTNYGGGFNGWIDEFRFSKGIARWTAPFTPESVAYSCGDDGYIKLLVHMNGDDASTTFTDDNSECVTFIPQVIIF